MKKLTYEEVLDETVKFYSEDVSRRSLTGAGECQYVGDGVNCAVGHWCHSPNPKWDRLDGGDSPTIAQLFMDYDLSFDEFKEEVRHLNTIAFWFRIQRLHDVNSNWDEKGLTGLGRGVVSKIKADIKQGKFK